ncbi:MAG TPA: ROK family protein [Candidatus Saccharimonadales bacterium]|nr:ROK family protein [Candidatus Saccharimonadales bacterium]
MFLAVDIGGTKTLLACFDDKGKITAEVKFATSQTYSEWLQDLAKNLPALKCDDFQKGCVAVPGRLDRENGIALGYGTLQWGQESIQADVEATTHCPILLENDAKLAGLSEGILLKDFKNVLYVTIGTGISCALITDGKINPALADSEGGQILIDDRGQAKQWEDVSSGHAIVERFGKLASEINDTEVWKSISRDFSRGLINLIAVIQPEVIVMGGGVSTNFDKYIPYLQKELKKYETPLVPIPPIRQAVHSEEAVIYGCYEYGKQHHEKPAAK